MAKPVDSSASPYCDAATFLCYYDERTVGDLVRDDGSQANRAELVAPDGKLAEALLAATGEVEAASTVGARYTPADLAALAASGTAGAALLRRFVADLAIGILLDRRPDAGPPPPQVAEARARLEALRRGDAVFPFPDSREAGLPAVVPIGPSDFARMSLISRNRRMFGERNSYRPPGTGS